MWPLRVLAKAFQTFWADVSGTLTSPGCRCSTGGTGAIHSSNVGMVAALLVQLRNPGWTMSSEARRLGAQWVCVTCEPLLCGGRAVWLRESAACLNQPTGSMQSSTALTCKAMRTLGPACAGRASRICWTCWPIILARTAERPEPLNGQRVRPARRPPATLLASTHAPVERRADGTGSHRCALLAQSRSLRNSSVVKPACRRIDANVPRFTTPC